MYSVVCNQQSILDKQKQANKAQFSHSPKTTENDRKRKIIVTYIVSKKQDHGQINGLALIAIQCIQNPTKTN
jgi:hypothetical protein